MINQFDCASPVRQLATLTAVCVALTACDAGPGAVNVDVSPMLDRQITAPADDGYPADVQIPVAAASVGSGLRLLPNDTALAGDNYIQVSPARGLGGRRSLDATLRAIGVLPSPFDFAISTDFRPLGGSDFAILERTPQEGVTCVLAVAPAGSATGGSNAVVMRNCVKGDVSEALAPLASFGAY